MTVEHDVTQLLGLVGTFPRPGWVVLDAAREHRFTGELVFESTPATKVYVDRGEIYVAERFTDASLGGRLVDAGVITAAQLERGAMRLGDVEHLGRLFDREPTIDRHAVLTAIEVLTDECIGWLASQQVTGVEATPYRHHPAGVHHWERADAPETGAREPLPAPPPTTEPVELAPPEPLFAPPTAVEDDVIQWAEPSWLDGPGRSMRPMRSAPAAAMPPPGSPTPQAPPAPPAAPAAPDEAPTIVPPPPPSIAAPPAATAPPSGAGRLRDQLAISGDWIQGVGAERSQAGAAEPLARPKSLPKVPIESVDRFELIWPTGEVDEQFGTSDAATVDDHHPDLDRRGPTARLDRAADSTLPTRPAAVGTLEPPSGEVDVSDFEREFEPDEPTEPLATRRPSTSALSPQTLQESSDEVVLAVRRAVASIETGALATRRRLAEPVTPDTSRGLDEGGAGSVAVQDEPVARGAGGTLRPATRSVFDDLPNEMPLEPAIESASQAAPEAVREGEPEARTGALRRLIGSLRRR